MKTIPLTNGLVAVVDDADYEWLSSWKWQSFVCKCGHVYARRNEQCGRSQRTILMHRIILDAPPGVWVDHRDNNGLNNQRSNIRICDRCENMANRRVHANNRMRFKGIRKTRAGHFQARIQSKGNPVHLGTFRSLSDAIKAYNHASARLHGEFANLNT